MRSELAHTLSAEQCVPSVYCSLTDITIAISALHAFCSWQTPTLGCKGKQQSSLPSQAMLIRSLSARPSPPLFSSLTTRPLDTKMPSLLRLQPADPRARRRAVTREAIAQTPVALAAAVRSGSAASKNYVRLSKGERMCRSHQQSRFRRGRAPGPRGTHDT